MGSFNRPRVFHPLDLEIMAAATEAGQRAERAGAGTVLPSAVCRLLRRYPDCTARLIGRID